MADAVPALATALATVRELSRQAQGRLTAVSPAGVRGNPHDPEVLDRAEAVGGDGLVLSFGGAHAVYELDGVALVSSDDDRAELSGRLLTRTTKAHGRDGQTTHRWRDARLVLTFDGDLALRLGATEGTPA